MWSAGKQAGPSGRRSIMAWRKSATPSPERAEMGMQAANSCSARYCSISGSKGPLSLCSRSVLLAELARDIDVEEQQVALAEGGAHGVHHALGQERIGFVDAGGVEEDDLGIGEGEHALDGGAGGLGFVGDDGDLGADELVQQRGLAGVGAAQDGDEAGLHGATGWERRTRT